MVQQFVRSDTMKTTKLLRCILIIGLVAAIMLSATGCKKKKETNPTDGASTPTQSVDNSATEGTTPAAEDTKPTTPTKPVTTTPTDATEATVETGPQCDHVTGGWIVDKASTCTSEGTRHKVCTLCGEDVETEAIPPISHSPGNWIVDKNPTCSAEGKRYQECSQCRTKVITANIAKTAHKEYTIPGYNATSTKTGLTDGKKCRVCGEMTLPQYVIPVLGSAGFGYHVNSDNTTCTIVALGACNDRTVSIPSAISGYKVTGIGDSAFENATNVATVYIPSTVTQIGEKAFYGCTGLTGISYQGTTSQWNAITKGLQWNGSTGNYTVQCTNGNITK